MPRRRLSLVVAAGALALAAITGCRVEPGNAAFVGDTTYSKADLDHMVDQFKKDGATVAAEDETLIRQEIARDQVFVGVAKRYADEQHYGTPNVDVSATARQYNMPPSDPVMQLLAEVDAYRTLLFDHVKAVTPTEAELHDVYDFLVKSKVGVGTYAETKPELLKLDGFNQAIGVRRVLTDAVRRYDVELNPLYDADFVIFTIPGQTSPIPIVPVRLTVGGTAVSDVSNP
jgi:hypothetical protein